MKCNWKELTLGDVTELTIDYRGKTPKKLGGDWSQGGYPVLSAKNIKTGQIVQQDTIRFLNEEMYHKWMKDEIQKGDIIVTSEAPFGQILYWNSDEKIVLGQRLFGVRIKEGYDSKFIYYYMTTTAFQAEMDSRATGTTVIGLRQPELMKCRLYCPNIDTQRRISKVLMSIDEKIVLNNKINNNLHEQTIAVFNKYYDTSTNQQPFSSIINVLSGGTPKTSNLDFWNGTIPFFTPKDAGDLYTFQTEKYITDTGLNHCNSRLYPSNTTFVTARGTVGKVSLAGIPMAMNQSCYALTSDVIDPILVYFYTLKAIESLKHKASGAVFDAIVTRDFNSEIIKILSNTDSKRILAIVSPMLENIRNNVAENMRLSTLRDTLLPHLMSGELDVSDIDL